MTPTTNRNKRKMKNLPLETKIEMAIAHYKKIARTEGYWEDTHGMRADFATRDTYRMVAMDLERLLKG